MSGKKWRALDHCDDNNNNNTQDTDVLEDNSQVLKSSQQSNEWIVVKDSEGVEVKTTDTQVAVSLQIAIQIAIAIVISITIGDNEQGRAVTQDLKQFMKTRQRNTQKTIVEGSRNVKVTTTDTDIAVNIQAMIEILVALVAKLDVL